MNELYTKIAQKQRKTLLALFKKALDAVNPYDCVKESLHLYKNTLSIFKNSNEIAQYNLNSFENVYIVGCGKAGAPMAAAVEDILGERITEGMVTVKYGHLQKRGLSRIAVTEAGHPEPDVNSQKAAEKAYSLLVNSQKNDLVIALLSGGGSALWTLPVEKVSLTDIISLNQLLIACGASIGEINTVRKQVSRIKGGKAAIAAYPATVIVLEISDVIGDDPKVIASGPFSQNKDTVEDALQLLENYNITRKVSDNILTYLHTSLHNNSHEGNNNSLFSSVTHCICANNSKALLAAVHSAEQMSYHVTVLDKPSCGEAQNTAKEFVHELKQIYLKEPVKNHCVVAGGETTVTLGDNFGIGGRNQEFALAAAFELDKVFEDLKNCFVSLLSCGTDGTDGPTDAAGAVVDLTTLISSDYDYSGDAKTALENHNAYPFFEKINSIIKTGPTNTNVMDIQIVLIENIM